MEFLVDVTACVSLLTIIKLKPVYVLIVVSVTSCVISTCMYVIHLLLSLKGKGKVVPALN
jgi:hypothetical protein